MIDKVINYFRTGADQPLRDLSDRSVRSEYTFSRWSVFLSTTIGYGFFYTCRLSLSVAKKPMLDAKILTPDEMGKIGFILLFVYAFGKFCNGFLADHSNIRRFMSSALLASAIVNILFGFQSLFWSFMVLWAINGWVQSIGSAPSVVSLCQWFSNKERGTRYGIWAASHSIGEGLTFVGTAALVATFGWRWGFWGPGIICVIVALVMFLVITDFV